MYFHAFILPRVHDPVLSHMLIFQPIENDNDNVFLFKLGGPLARGYF